MQIMFSRFNTTERAVLRDINPLSKQDKQDTGNKRANRTQTYAAFVYCLLRFISPKSAQFGVLNHSHNTFTYIVVERVLRKTMRFYFTFFLIRTGTMFLGNHSGFGL